MNVILKNIIAVIALQKLGMWSRVSFAKHFKSLVSDICSYIILSTHMLTFPPSKIRKYRSGCVLFKLQKLLMLLRLEFAEIPPGHLIYMTSSEGFRKDFNEYD